MALRDFFRFSQATPKRESILKDMPEIRHAMDEVREEEQRLLLANPLELSDEDRERRHQLFVRNEEEVRSFNQMLAFNNLD